jgi:Flp pilus assembly protein TadD
VNEARIRITVGASLAAAALLAGCQQRVDDAPKTAPGELPARNQTDASPRLSATTLFAHAHLLERQGDFERAAFEYRRAIDMLPTFVAARNRLGITLNKLGRHAEASEQFQTILAEHPRFAYVLNNVGFSQYLEGKLAEASASLEQAIELKPTFKRAHMNLGVVLGRMGQYTRALDEFRHAGPEPDAYYNVAMLQTEAGLYADAAQSLDAALKLNPKLEPARRQLREVSRLAAEEAQHEAQVLAVARAKAQAEERMRRPGTSRPPLLEDADPTDETAQLSNSVERAGQPEPSEPTAPSEPDEVVLPMEDVSADAIAPARVTSPPPAAADGRPADDFYAGQRHDPAGAELWDGGTFEEGSKAGANGSFEEFGFETETFTLVAGALFERPLGLPAADTSTWSLTGADAREASAEAAFLLPADFPSANEPDRGAHDDLTRLPSEMQATSGVPVAETYAAERWTTGVSDVATPARSWDCVTAWIAGVHAGVQPTAELACELARCLEGGRTRAHDAIR